MKTKFTILIAAGLLLTVATTQAQNDYSKKYAVNYPAHNSGAMNKPGSFNKEEKMNNKSFEKNDRKYHKGMKKHHRHHHKANGRHHRH